MNAMNLRRLHEDAMNVAERAFLIKDPASTAKSKMLQEAFAKERQAAELASNLTPSEPTRSVLLRSAASLALDCQEFREAERLIAIGLSGSPPDDIAEEMRDLLEQVHFRRHLDLRGLVLEPAEVQLSLAGKAVGFGMIQSDEVVERVQAFEKMVFRTAERKMHHPYRESGNVPSLIREAYEILLSAPRAASFAVSLKVGRPKSQPMLGCDVVSVVDDIADNLDLLNQNKESELLKQIPEPAYFRNFVGLARQLAPGGDDVKLVGLTFLRHGQERRIQLTRLGSQIHLQGSNSDRPASKKVRVTGTLLFADALHGRDMIKLKEKNGKEHKIIVPEGMMSDIVKPLWNNIVTVDGVANHQFTELLRIEKSE